MLKDATCFIANCLPLDKFGVSSEIFPRKKSKIYFFIYWSLIELLINLNFFSNIARDVGELFEYIKGDKDSIMGLPIKDILNYIKVYKK